MIKLLFLSNLLAVQAVKELTAVHYSIVSPGIDQNITAGKLQQKVSNDSYDIKYNIITNNLVDFKPTTTGTAISVPSRKMAKRLI